ncbi:hypothetical protein NE237_013466 [Protea cynaroides]|uniref:PHD-type domain-containing protein n=1 Tax=Protea cynaroides TaxID=273540 RepID=A0A9Q0GZE5_9MAGN|nr:hypothetical protein NE237_013466 [Protea cynaroides]
MIVCDQCDVWYHFDCINVMEPPPKTSVCPACEPLTEELLPNQNERLRLVNGCILEENTCPRGNCSLFLRWSFKQFLFFSTNCQASTMTIIRTKQHQGCRSPNNSTPAL